MGDMQKNNYTSRDFYEGSGWYNIKWSDGGQDFTNEGPVWVGGFRDMNDLLAQAFEDCHSDEHVPYAEVALIENDTVGYYDGCPMWREWRYENLDGERYSVLHTPSGVYGIYFQVRSVGETELELVCKADDYNAWNDACFTHDGEAFARLTEDAKAAGLPEYAL